MKTDEESNGKKQTFIPMQFYVQEGDIIISKKGILQYSPLSKEYFLVKKFRVIGNNYTEVIGNEEKINIKKLKRMRENEY